MSRARRRRRAARWARYFNRYAAASDGQVRLAGAGGVRYVWDSVYRRDGGVWSYVRRQAR